MTDDPAQIRAIAWQAAATIGALMAVGALAIPLLRARRAKDARDETPAKPALWKRFGTLLALVFGVLGSAAWGLWPFAGVVALLTLAGLAEFWSLLAARGSGAYRAIGWASGLALVLSAAAWGAPALGLVLTGSLLLLLGRVLREPERATLVERLAGTWLGTAYVGLTLAYLVLLRGGHDGFGRLVFVLAIVQMADVFALLGGMAFGRHALAPALSGGKTWEGLACGVASALVGARLFAFALPGEPLAHGLAIALVLALGALAGDLSASALKRAAGLKDFGRLLPGHGGVLDRFDSYLVAAPLAYFVFALLDRLG